MFALGSKALVCSLVSVTQRDSARRFKTTRWSLVVSAGHDDEAGRRALNELCTLYWYPLYAYLRRQGRQSDEAKDLTQGFFTRLIERQDVAKVSVEGGRFRSFLLAGARNFAANEWGKEQTLKRGQGQVITVDLADAEARYVLEPVDLESPDKVFARRWALTVLDTVLVQLEDEMAAKGADHVFAHLKVFLEGDGRGPAYSQLAKQLEMTEGTVKVAVHRLRRRFRELLLLEVGHTVADPVDVDAEVAELLEALRA